MHVIQKWTLRMDSLETNRIIVGKSVLCLRPFLLNCLNMELALELPVILVARTLSLSSFIMQDKRT